jgi:hypothetical protein
VSAALKIERIEKYDQFFPLNRTKTRVMRLVSAFLIIFFIAVLFPVCAAVQSSVKDRENPLLALDSLEKFGALDKGAAVYAAVDVKNARDLLELCGMGGQYGELLEKTASAVAAFYPNGGERRFLIATRGDYPDTLPALFAMSADWKKERARNNVSYWRSHVRGVSLALNSHRALFSDGEPFGFVTGAVSEPSGFDAFQQGAVIAGWLTDKGEALNHLLTVLEIPIRLQMESAFFTFHKTDREQYELTLHIETPTEELAKNFAVLFSLARLFIAENSETDTQQSALPVQLLTNPAEQAGVFLTIRSTALDAGNAALLITIFLNFFNSF